MTLLDKLIPNKFKSFLKHKKERLDLNKNYSEKLKQIFKFKIFPEELNNLNIKKRKIISKRNQLECLNEEINKEIKNLEEKIADYDLTISNNSKKLKELIQKLDDININVSNINLKIKEFIKESKDYSKLENELNELNKDYKRISKIKVDLLSENKNISDKLLLSNKNTIQNKKAELNKNKDEILSINTSLLDLEDKISNLTNLKGLNDERNNKLKTFYLLFFPIFIFGIYFYGIGRSRFYVVSDVVVRKSLSSNNSNDSLSFLGVGNQSSREDARFLKIYLESPQILEDLGKIINFRSDYRKNGLDIFSGVDKNINKDKLHKFFKKQVKINFDQVSGALKLTTIGYYPEVAYKFNTFLIQKSEQFVNELNQSIYLRQINFVENQVNLNFEKLNIAKIKLEEFQNETKTINLNQEVLSATALITSLEEQLTESKLKLSFLKRQFVDQEAPEIMIVNNEIDDLKSQINEQREILSDPNSKNYISRLGILNSLKSNLSFRNDIYNSSLATAEKTKLDAQKQQRFIAILSKPTFPEDQDMNWRHKWFLTFVVSLLIGYFLTRFILGISESHNN